MHPPPSDDHVSFIFIALIRPRYSEGIDSPIVVSCKLTVRKQLRLAYLWSDTPCWPGIIPFQEPSPDCICLPQRCHKAHDCLPALEPQIPLEVKLAACWQSGLSLREGIVLHFQSQWTPIDSGTQHKTRKILELWTFDFHGYTECCRGEYPVIL